MQPGFGRVVLGGRAAAVGCRLGGAAPSPLEGVGEHFELRRRESAFGSEGGVSIVGLVPGFPVFLGFRLARGGGSVAGWGGSHDHII